MPVTAGKNLPTQSTNTLKQWVAKLTKALKKSATVVTVRYVVRTRCAAQNLFCPQHSPSRHPLTHIAAKKLSEANTQTSNGLVVLFLLGPTVH